MRSASLIILLLEDGKLIAVFDELDAVADGHFASLNARSEAAAGIEGDDGDLIGSFVNVLCRSGVNGGLGVNDTRAGIGIFVAHAAAPRIVTTQVAPDPPRFWASPNE